MELDGSICAYDIVAVDRTKMRIFRIMMALVIALSVAMLPTAGSAVSIVNPASQDASDAMSVSKDMIMASDMSGAMDECCPDHAKPCDQPTHQCPLACCMVQPISLAGVAAFHLNSPIVAGNPLPIPVDQVVALHSGSPPFRPPRI
jgi:hypothetical protein